MRSGRSITTSTSPPPPSAPEILFSPFPPTYSQTPPPPPLPPPPSPPSPLPGSDRVLFRLYSRREPAAATRSPLEPPHTPLTASVREIGRRKLQIPDRHHLTFSDNPSFSSPPADIERGHQRGSSCQGSRLRCHYYLPPTLIPPFPPGPYTHSQYCQHTPPKLLAATLTGEYSAFSRGDLFLRKHARFCSA